MYCPFCRTTLPDGSKFCSGCGKPLPAAPTNATPDPTLAAGVRPPISGEPLADDRPPVAGEMHGGARDRAVPIAGRAEVSASDLWSERRAGVPPYREPEPESRSWLLPAVAALLALLLVGGAGIWLLRRPQSAPVSVTAVRANPVPPGPSVVRSTGAPPSGPPVAAQPARPGMPEDIRRYLSFLEGVEAQRKQYEGQLTNRMLGMIPNLLMPNFDADNVQPPDQQMVRQYDAMAQEYARATMRFQAASQQIQVPMACRKLHAYYSTALSMNPRLISETARSLQSGNYSGLLSMRGSVGKQIEDNYAAADQELAIICSQYNVRKPFDIGNGSGGNSVLLP